MCTHSAMCRVQVAEDRRRDACATPACVPCARTHIQQTYFEHRVGADAHQVSTIAVKRHRPDGVVMRIVQRACHYPVIVWIECIETNRVVVRARHEDLRTITARCLLHTPLLVDATRTSSRRQCALVVWNSIANRSLRRLQVAHARACPRAPSHTHTDLSREHVATNRPLGEYAAHFTSFS